MGEDADDGEQFVGRIAFHEAEEGRVKAVGPLQLVCILTGKDDTVVDKLADNQTQDLAQVSSRDEFLCKNVSHNGLGQERLTYLE